MGNKKIETENSNTDQKPFRHNLRDYETRSKI